MRNQFNKLRSRKAEPIYLIRNWAKWYTDGFGTSPTFPLPLFLCHLFKNCSIEIYLVVRVIYVEYSLDLCESPRFLELYLQDHLIQFPVFLLFSMTFSANSKLSLISLASPFKSFISFTVISKLPLIIFIIFFSCF